MRTLYYVPIIHARADMGSADELFAAIGLPPSQYDSLMRRVSLIESDIDTYWQSLSTTVVDVLQNEGVIGTAQAAHKLRIYNDSFVKSDTSLKFFQKTFPGSRHVSLLQTLIGFGGEIQDTEHADKVAECIRYLSSPGNRSVWTNLESFIEDRDRYIAENIHKNLNDGEYAILFMGAAHDVPRYIPPSIRIKVIHRADVFTSQLEMMPMSFKNMVRSSYLNLADSYGHTIRPGIV